MNKITLISKKRYVAPFISFEEVEEEQELLAGSTTEATSPGLEPGEDISEENPDLAKKSGAFGAENDFVFEIDDIE